MTVANQNAKTWGFLLRFQILHHRMVMVMLVLIMKALCQTLNVHLVLATVIIFSFFLEKEIEAHGGLGRLREVQGHTLMMEPIAFTAVLIMQCECRYINRTRDRLISLRNISLRKI